MQESGEANSWPYKRLNELLGQAVEAEGTDALEDAMRREVERLKALDYKVYLQTEEWKQTRSFALNRAGLRCQMCNRATKLQVHHRTYERLGEEWLDDLTVLCGDCHKTFHEHRDLAAA